MIRIVVLDKGFVSVGTFSKDPDHDGWFMLENAAIVRRWGTSKGLGELAEKGPLTSTVLDQTPTQRFPPHAIMNTIECVPKVWKKHLNAD
jgi:hypothetical protein